ncbi:acyltransferase [Pedococcus sp. 5OH_020]|uniref:acyltransferase n=1 Tax=Pedococcus sp. 5OH_020 TaxID=2989814 RepID=UPI0022E9E8B4|nr:acyltransferase [Pedococcus sp. 5OH_020]
MSELGRRLAAVAYDSFARHLHTLLPGGHRLRAWLANRICERVASTASIEPGARLSRYLVVEDRAGIGASSWFIGGGSIHLGRNLRMGPQCLFITNDHPVPGHGQTFDDVQGTSRPITVEDDVFLGARTVVLPGVTIGTGATVGAASVVTKDIPAGAVAAGSPARVLRVRQVRDA